MRKKEIVMKPCRIPRNIFATCCKVYHDGNHFVGVPVIHKNRPTYSSTVNEFANETVFFDKQYTTLLSAGIKPNARKMFCPLKDAMLKQYPDLPNADDFLTINIKRQRHNFFARIKRLRRKANLNIWNKWVTITYDDKKHTEITFRNKLKKCLSNLHTRRGWRYMGVFERAPETNRLHFHAVMYIPEDEMIGVILEQKDYSTMKHCMQITHSNDFFARKFGRNDFEELNEADLHSGDTLSYLIKYISKTNERVTYSRGIPTELTVNLEERDIACVYMDYVTKFVLFDDCVNKNNGYTPSKPLKYGQWSIDDYLDCA